MRGRILWATAALWGLAAGWATGALASEAPATAWDDYRLGQYISSRDRTPADILDLDNNGDILLACRDGCTPATLAGAGIQAIDSQLELLRTWSLLAWDGSGYRAAIPILDGDDARYLDELAGGLAETIAAVATDEVRGLVAALDADGLAAHAWTVVFAYVLDGAVWEFFGELELIASRAVSRGGAPWGGEVWLYRAGGEPSTSTVRRPAFAVKMSWVESLWPHVVALMGGPGGLASVLEAGTEPSAEVLARLERYGVLDAERRVLVPVIREGSADELYRRCEQLTERVVSTLQARLNRAALVEDLGFASESQALVVAYHEVMWSLLDRLVAAGLIEEPAAIADPDAARPEDVGKLVLLVRRAGEVRPADEDAAPVRDED